MKCKLVLLLHPTHCATLRNVFLCVSPGVPLVYELELQGDKLVPVKSDRAAPGLSGYYIGDQAAIEAQTAAVAAQGKAKK